MNSFFVTDAIYKERIAICKSCDKYIKLLGNCSICKCFMKIKSRIANQECADNPKKWIKTTEVKRIKNLPQDIVDEVLKIYPDIETGKAKNIEVKKQIIQLYNIIHNTEYDTNTNCRSCLNTVYKAIKNLYNEHKK